MLEERFPTAKFLNLLDSRVFRELSASPELMRERLKPDEKLIIIDEIQKLPSLLDEVHLLMERDKKLRFILTGSSMRKLRRGQANLLAGRALSARLHPLVHPEVPGVPLIDRLTRGGLPPILTSPIPAEDLDAYVGDYLQEEIQGEFESRNLESFSRFLTVAASCNGEQVNYTNLAGDLGINPKTVREYFQVLEDTLLGVQVEPFDGGSKRKAVSSAKFYFFDVGVANTLLGRSTSSLSADDWGRCLEHLLFTELRAYLDYSRKSLPLTFWRTYSKLEVDFVIDSSIAIEVKAKQKISGHDLKGLRALSEEITLKRKILVCREAEPRKTSDGIEVYPVSIFLDALWGGEFC